MGGALERIDRWSGRRVLVLLLALALCACNSVPVAKDESGSLQQHIRSGELIKPGDRVRLGTTGGDTREFQVTAVDTEHVFGPGAEVAIDTIESCVVLPRHPGRVHKALVTTAALVALAALVAAYVYVSWEPNFRYESNAH